MLRLPEQVRKAVFERGSVKPFKEGSIIYYPGAVCDYVPLVLSGEIKVYLTTENGREILLYKVTDGETCMLTNLSVLRDKPYPAYAVAFRESRVLLIPSERAKELFNSYPEWREFVLDMFVKDGWLLASRMSEVISRRVDKRLAEYILENVGNKGVIFVTHEDIAKDLGTVREVVSRILKRFESQGALKVSRGRIEIVDIQKLKHLSSVT